MPERSNRLRVAVLLDHLNAFSGGYEAQLREAIHAKCRQAGHHLLMVYGGPVEAPRQPDAADNAIYELLRPDSADGIIVISTLLSTYGGPDSVARLIQRFGQARLCSVGIEMPSVPSLVLDNRPGMEAVVEHLIRDHGCRKLAFLAGTPENPEAKVRFDAYQAVLTRYGLPCDPALIAPGYFRTNSAKVAMEEILARGVEIDGVVAANDEMATGAVDVLRKHGLRVPQDVSVTGFDDLMQARLGNPPLTTVAQPFEAVADWAVRAIEAQVAGQPVAPCTQVAARFVRRQSCGCGYEAYRRDSQTMPAVRSADTESIVDRLGTLWPVLTGLLGTGFSSGAEAATRLLDALRAEIGGKREAVHDAIVALLDNAGTDNERQRMLHSAICYVRDELRGWSNLDVERVLFDALNLVALSNTTSQMQHRLLLDENYLRLLGIGEQASIAFDLASLRDALVKGLPSAGVRTAYLACVVGGVPNLLRSAMCLRDGELLASENVEYAASQLLPPGALTDDARESFLVLPLAFENQLLGVIAFSYSDGINAYAAFRNEIAAALKSIRLREELVRTSMLHERSVQERLAATKRMEALSVLAGGVAHDLNNALGPLVALPDLILGQLGEMQGREESVRDLRADVETIKVASLRAAQTIKDLLALGRQGRMVKENVDINRVIKSGWANSSLRFVEDGSQSRVNMIADLSPTPLMVRGSESQLARAVDNLIRNAVEAIGGNGEVVVKSAKVDVHEPRVGYETVPAGQYATLSVSDDGCGIEPLDLSQVFEPFFTRKRAKESSGSGLGLAIVHGVVKEHDGYIDVVSTPEVGTTITLYFPLVDGLERTERESVTPHGTARILIVDDEPIQLRTGRRVLVRLGYEVEVMDSGLRAYELFSRAAASGQSPFDLVIMDMVLGEVHDGLQIVEQIHRLFPSQKVIVASGHAPTERAELAVKKGLTWLTKPYGMEALAETVQRALRGDAGPH
ncbi:MAG TPA: substrate-binding domain-containing protein [Polyangia bacterium]|jgi:DNA-binding LacI/PurR family transcriptional regulator/signal transduction histidine kinase/ActR/RegA family two-component response regulator|nr:substrate-binding domain-containing protein [Polyangia bacterium]